MRWLGVGTGRCGTKSLASWGGGLHESIRLPWSKVDILEKIAPRMIQRAEPEVSFMWLGHWRRARVVDPELPIICLHRDKFDTVASHIRVCGGKDRLVAGRMQGYYSDAYPILQDQDTTSCDAWGIWWDLAEDIMSTIAEPVWHLPMLDLNDETKMAALETWLRERNRWVC